MESTDSPAGDGSENRDEKSADSEITMSKIEAMVTPEQVLSASVARRRRNIAKKRSSSVHKPRDLTPVRDIVNITSSSDDNERVVTKTPERPRRKVIRSSSENIRRKSEGELQKKREGTPVKSGRKNSLEIQTKTDIPRDAEVKLEEEKDEKIENIVPKENIEKNEETSEVKPKVKKEEKPKTDRVRHSSLTRNGSIPRQYDNAKAMLKNSVSSIANITQDDVKALLRRAKKTMTPSKKKEVARRSQSNPPQFTEEELIESFKRAKLISDDNEEAEQKKLNRYSSASSTDVEKPKEKKQYRPEVQDLVVKRRIQRRQVPSEKIIQVIDPRTSRILATRAQSQLKFKLFDFLRILKYMTIKDIIKEYRAFKVDMKHERDRIRILRNKCFSELFLMMILCGLGSMMFKTVEGAFENFYKCGVKRVKRDFIDNLWMKSHSMREEDWKSLARSKLRIFEEELHNAHEAGVHTYSGQRSWSFLNGIVYCLTIVTTIGYGHMAPTTVTGRALTIVYAIIGIPLFLIILTDFGKLFTRSIKYVWSFVRRVYYTGNCRRVRKQAHVEDIMKGAQFMYEVATFRRPSMFAAPNEEPQENKDDQTTNTPTTPAPSNFEIDDEFNLPISLAIFILLLYIFLGSLIYLYWEEWDFFASFYFVFISMSTIGFGDFVPQNAICMIVSIVYLVFGLALMSMCINVVQAKLSDTFKDASAKIGATIGLSVADEDGSITTVAPAPVELPEIHETEKNGRDKKKEDDSKNS